LAVKRRRGRRRAIGTRAPLVVVRSKNRNGRETNELDGVG
jgi:hypothetical protein